jgi:hypothetical protein
MFLQQIEIFPGGVCRAEIEIYSCPACQQNNIVDAGSACWILSYLFTS